MFTVIIFVHRMASIWSLTVSIVTPFSCTKTYFLRIASSPMVRSRSMNARTSLEQITRNSFSETTLVALSMRMVATAEIKKFYFHSNHWSFIGSKWYILSVVCGVRLNRSRIPLSRSEWPTILSATALLVRAKRINILMQLKFVLFSGFSDVRM